MIRRLPCVVSGVATVNWDADSKGEAMIAIMRCRFSAEDETRAALKDVVTFLRDPKNATLPPPSVMICQGSREN